MPGNRFGFEKLRLYFLIHRFDVETDYKPLEWIKSVRYPGGKIARWVLRQQGCDFTIGHILRKKNNIPNILSWNTAEEEGLSTFAFGVGNKETVNNPTARHKAQHENSIIYEVIKDVLASETPQMKPLWCEFSRFVWRWLGLHVNEAGVLLIHAD